MLRWQIELFFKSIKSMLNADQITSANEKTALSIAYCSILASLIASSIIIEDAEAVAHVELKPNSKFLICCKLGTLRAKDSINNFIAEIMPRHRKGRVFKREQR